MNLKHFLTKTYIRLHERTFKKRLKYVFLKNHSDTLVISFSGFSPKPSYNYMRSLKDVKTDKLFILDDFGIRGSYYWFENGQDLPRELVQSLVSQVVARGGYKRVITLGSSKGGTCAIYYGLIFGASDIYAGACQYYAGTYLSSEEHRPILRAMMGDMPDEEARTVVDRMMPDLLKQYAGSKSKIHLLYSKAEHTYDEHIKYMIEDLKKYGYDYTEQLEDFKDHNDVGKFFPKFIQQGINEVEYNGQKQAVQDSPLPLHQRH